MVTIAGVPLQQGKMYRIRMRYQAGNGRWVEREMQAKYLWPGGAGADAGCEVFSGRPAFGNCAVPKDQVVSIIRVHNGPGIGHIAQPFAPRPVR